MTKEFENVKGFFLYFDQCEALEDLTDEQAGMLFKGIVARFQGREFDFTDKTVRVVFRFFEVAFRQEQEKYKQICEKRRENIKRRWHTNENKAIQNDTKDTSVYKCISDDTNENKAIQNIPYLNPEPEPELKQEENNNIIFVQPKAAKTTTQKFIPPSPEDVDAYCQEKGYAINGQSFCDYYEARGWMMGKAKMKNWKAAVSTWVRNDRSFPSQGPPQTPWEQKEQARIAEFQALKAKAGW